MKNTNSFLILIIKGSLLLGLYGLFCSSVHGQDIKLSDSLEIDYKTGNYKKENELRLLFDIAANIPDPDIMIKYSNVLLQKAQEADSTQYVLRALIQKGSAFRLKGDLKKSLETYFEGVEIAIIKKDSVMLGNLYTSISAVYSVMDNHKNSSEYFKKAIPFFKDPKNESDSISYASLMENIGDEYNLKLAKPDSALIFFKESGAIFRALDFKIGIAYNLGNSGLAYAQQGKNKIAEENIVTAIEMLTELGDYYPICVYLTYMADIYAEQNKMDEAFYYANKSLELAQEYGLKEEISDAHLKLSELYEKTGEATKSLHHYKDYIVFKDSVQSVASVQQLADISTEFKVNQKQIEVDLLNHQKRNQRNIVIATSIALFLIGALAFGLFRRFLFIRKTKQIIEDEKNRSDKLLLNILPEETAKELKQFGKVSAKKFESVTVLFTDFVGFTSYAEKLTPEELVESVDFYFSKFDDIIDKHGLEKIKTIGDSYMCAGGIPFPSEDHAIRMLNATFEIVKFVEEAKNNNFDNKTRFDIRIGINTGPVVAGVVGKKKFIYDIWGDTVNIASRMESNSEPGKINISENTYQLIKNSYNCDYRGEFEVKNRGMMPMYFVYPKKSTKIIKQLQEIKIKNNGTGF